MRPPNCCPPLQITTPQVRDASVSCRPLPFAAAPPTFRLQSHTTEGQMPRYTACPAATAAITAVLRPFRERSPFSCSIAAPLRSYTAVFRCRCAAVPMRSCAAVPLRCCSLAPPCRRCATAAPPLRHRWAGCATAGPAAPPLRHRCATAAPSRRHRGGTAVPLRRCAVVLLCRRVPVPQARAAAVPLRLPTSTFTTMTSRLQMPSRRRFVDDIAPLTSTAATTDPKQPFRAR
jgi:hypothetical protein